MPVQRIGPPPTRESIAKTARSRSTKFQRSAQRSDVEGKANREGFGDGGDVEYGDDEDFEDGGYGSDGFEDADGASSKGPDVYSEHEFEEEEDGLAEIAEAHDEYSDAAFEEDVEDEGESEKKSTEVEHDDYGASDFEDEEDEAEAEMQAFLRAQDAEAIRRRTASAHAAAQKDAPDGYHVEAIRAHERGQWQENGRDAVGLQSSEWAGGSGGDGGGGGRLNDDEDSLITATVEREHSLEDNPFAPGGLVESAAVVLQAASAAADEVVERIDAQADPFPPRKDWILDPARSMWGIGGQGDRVDAGGHRGTAPYSVIYAGDYSWVYIKGLNPAVSRRLVCEVLLLFGPLSSLRLRVTPDRTRLPPGSKAPGRNAASSSDEGGWQGRCEAYAQFASTAAAAKAVIILHGQAISVAQDELRVGDKALPRRQVTEEELAGIEDGSGGAPKSSTGGWYEGPSMLAVFEFFYAVRDGDVARVEDMLKQGLVDPCAPLLPQHFPASGARQFRGHDAWAEAVSGEGAGRQQEERPEGWPRHGFEGVHGDSALHLAARHADVAMVEVLLAGGASPLVTNRDKEKVVECLGVRCQARQQMDEEEGAVEAEDGDVRTDEEKEAEEERLETIWSLLSAAEARLAGQQAEELLVSRCLEMLPISAKGYTVINDATADVGDDSTLDARHWAGGAWRHVGG